MMLPLRSSRRLLQQTQHRLGSFSFVTNHKQSKPPSYKSFSSYAFVAPQSSHLEDGSLEFATGQLGHLSESSVMCRTGDTVVHASVNSSFNEGAADLQLPLTVDYRCRNYAFGILPENKKRRERNGTDEEVLVARFIDRACRPLFPKGYVDEVQVTVSNHAADGVTDPTVSGLNAVSCALMLSRQPWAGPIGCCRIGLIDGELKVNPTLEEMETSVVDLLYAGTLSRTLMIECMSNEVSEDTIAEAMNLAHESIKPIINLQIQMKADQNNQLQNLGTAPPKKAKRGLVVPEGMIEALMRAGGEEAATVYSQGLDDKEERSRAEGKLRAKLVESLTTNPDFSTAHKLQVEMAVEGLLHDAFRKALLDTKIRSDGRKEEELRPISCAAEVMPVVHGSSYFTRGDTHVLCTTTLGSKKDSELFVDIRGQYLEEQEDHFVLNYDFPPYATGELGNATAVNRRMVGHGNLAEKALRPVMPSLEAFPYTVRLFAECTSSNGSSSMASACSGSLALMDAGVPIKAAVAGVSVGLMTEVDSESGVSGPGDKELVPGQDGPKIQRYTLLKDILGSEDHHGDMDFKVAGTREGITAIQLDVKLEGGVPLAILNEALDVAKAGRLQILDTMDKVLSKARVGVKEHAPKAEIVEVDIERVSQLIGHGGEMKRFLQDTYECEIEIEENQVYIYGRDGQKIHEAKNMVEDIAVTVKPGDRVIATILDVKDFGLIVRVNRAQEALMHISELTHDEELQKRQLPEIFSPGQRLECLVFFVHKATGLVKVSRKQMLDAETSVPDRVVFIEDPLTITAAVPTFPEIPPRKWSRDFFRDNVVSKQDVEKAMEEAGSNNLQSFDNMANNTEKRPKFQSKVARRSESRFKNKDKDRSRKEKERFERKSERKQS